MNSWKRPELPPRVGINAVFLRPRMGGLETYVNAILPELVRLAPQVQFTVFCGPQGVEQLRAQPWSPDVRLVTHPLLGQPGLKALSELTVLGGLASRRVDLLHNVAMTGPLRTRATNVVMIPDLTWLIAPDPGDAITNRIWRLVVPPVARRADRLMAVSRATADDISRHLGVEADRIDVVPHGPGIAAPAAATEEVVLRRRFELEGPIILTVSAKRVHKNLVRLIEAMITVRERRPDVVLVMPGNPTPHEQELKTLVRRNGLERNVAFLHYVDQSDLEGLYRSARCFVVAATNEGFGLPVLEAMQRGVPVACARSSALPEVAGDAAEYFDPLRTADIARALITLLDDDQRAAWLADAGPRQAERFSWEHAAQKTLESWSRAWRGPAPR